jgi:predicted Rossmann-fold nucleotide-binding protein
MSDAFVVVPGGAGTAVEMLMIWQLLQVQVIYRNVTAGFYIFIFNPDDRNERFTVFSPGAEF